MIATKEVCNILSYQLAYLKTRTRNELGRFGEADFVMVFTTRINDKGKLPNPNVNVQAPARPRANGLVAGVGLALSSNPAIVTPTQLDAHAYHGNQYIIGLVESLTSLSSITLCFCLNIFVGNCVYPIGTDIRLLFDNPK